MRVAIIDLGVSNTGSVQSAVNLLGKDNVVCKSPKDIKNATHLILPGVGAFQSAVEAMQKSGWIEALERHVLQEKKPVIGLCLGMQIMATTSNEYGEHQGLNWIPGRVERFELEKHALPVPHVGWNDITVKKPSILYKGLPSTLSLYFVHSYRYRPNSQSVVSSTCQYGHEFVASIEHENIFATQFHPERSQTIGLKILSNFLNHKFS